MPKGTHSNADADVHVRRSGRKSKPRALSDMLGERFSMQNMGPRAKRGAVLCVYKSKLREALGTPLFMKDLKGAVIKPSPLQGRQNRASSSSEIQRGVDGLTLVIMFKPGSPWRNEVFQRRHQIKTLINERLKTENFITKIYLK